MPATNASTVNPIWTGRKFGVEMEFHKRSRLENGSSRELTAQQVNAALRARCTMPVHGNGGTTQSQYGGAAWEVKYDSTAGWEVVTPALTMGEDGRCAELEAGCGALGGLRPVIDASCGLHVHVDVSDFSWQDLQNLTAMWARYEPFFYSLMPQSRHNNAFCQPIRGAKWTDVSVQRRNEQRDGAAIAPALTARDEAAFRQAASAAGKYRSLRLEHFWRTGRVEFRLAAGSVNYDKIRRWVTLLLSVVGRVKAAGRTFPRLNANINQPRPELGFSSVYVLAAVGLGPSRWQADSQTYREVLEFCNERRARFGHDRRPGAPAATR